MNETLTILEKVNSFYSGAWLQLVIYTTVMFTIIGILIPILVQFYQRRVLKLEKDSLERIIKEEIDDIGKNINTLISDEVSRQSSKIEKRINSAEGGNFHIQGNYYLDKKWYGIALSSLAIAGKSYIDADDELNLGRIIKSITNNCLPNMYSGNFNGVFKDNEKKVQELLSALKKYDVNGRYSDRINGMVNALEEALKRDKEKQEK